MASEAKVKLVLAGEDKTSPAFASASKGAGGFGASIKGLLPVLGVAGLAGAIGGIIQQTADFEQQLSDVSTLMTGDSTNAVNDLRDGIQELLKTTPKSADELGAAAYQIVSAGISDTDDALKTLKASTRLAVAGLGTTEEATTLLATAMNAFGKNADDAEQVADVLFKTVKAGQTNVQQLSQAFGKMAGNAAAANISLEDVQAATAAITTVTGKTSEAQNALAQVFLELTVAGGKLDKSLQDQGSSLDQLNSYIGDEGLGVGMARLRDELGLTDTEFKNMFSSAEGGTAVFQLLTSASDAYNKTLDDMAVGSNALDAAVQKQNQQFNAQFQLLKNNLNVEFQKLAIQILPALIAGMQVLGPVLEGIHWFFENLVDALSEFILMVMKAIDAVKQLASLTAGGFNAVTDFLGGGIYTAASTLGIPGFADGGIVPGSVGAPQLALVHGGEEVVSYADRMRGGGGSNITVVISGNTLLDERSADKIGNLLTDRLRTQFRF